MQKKVVSEKQRFSFEEVKKEFTQRGFTLIDKEYTAKNQKLNYICGIHNKIVQRITLQDLKHSVAGCQLCSIQRRSGEGSPNWKGGISSLHERLRQSIKQWKTDSMIECNYKCVITGGRFNVIHHLYSFNLIIQETLAELDLPLLRKASEYTKEEFAKIQDKLLEVHYRYPLGVCLTNEMHDAYHAQYGRENNIPEQFYAFKEKSLKNAQS